MRKFLLMIMLICLTSFSAFATEDGSVYQKEDGKYYQMIDGKEVEIDRGSGDSQSISDVFSNYSSTTTPDSEVMQEVAQKTSFIGTITSVIIYLIFAATALTTAIDLLYIALPPLRPLLYNPSGKDSVTNVNAYHMTQAGVNAMDDQMRANNRAAEAQQWANTAQMRAANGDMSGARSAMRISGYKQESANRNQRWANEWANKQRQNDAIYQNEVQDKVNRAHKNNGV